MIQFLAHVSGVMLVVCGSGYLIACFVTWYLLAALNYSLNGGQLGRHRLWFPFQCFTEEIRCYWFGGKTHRIEFIKSRCDGDGFFISSKRSFTHQEVRDNNLYETVFWGMCGGRLSFWTEHSIYFLFGPLFVSALFAAVLIGIVMSRARWLFGTARARFAS